jgi:hypothetical protein
MIGTDVLGWHQHDVTALRGTNLGDVLADSAKAASRRRIQADGLPTGLPKVTEV